MDKIDQKIEAIKTEQAELDRRTRVEKEAEALIFQCRFEEANKLLDSLDNEEFLEEEKKMSYDRIYPQCGDLQVPADGFPEVCKYAAEARMFLSGKIIAKVRSAADGEETNMYETRTCDIWVDVFDSRQEAEQFCQQYWQT